MNKTATQAAGVLPTAEIRSHFPALERVHEGRRVAYFDGPGGTQVPREVVGAMADYLYKHNANTHWRYPTSEETDAALAAALAEAGLAVDAYLTGDGSWVRAVPASRGEALGPSPR